ncbi:DNA polymerase IV [Thermoactinospora rubra]|uniref:DNA polymerase IV n=1 Tax=Thermoactinospora rubra TaxID=1088767 RepID=UPI000A1000EA|nr:DNA polymerase IV [Thermoactinospora rubra]
MRNWILHVDLDSFMAAVETLRNPELRGRPVIVGADGDPTRPRTVVSTASYEARQYGVHSGMPMRTAHRKCPDAIFLPVDLPAYETVSAQVMDVLRTFPVVVEVWGLDEAFLGCRTDDPEALARDIQRAVHERTGLTCSIGIGDNKHQAKLAAGFRKPAGVARLTGDDWTAVMGERPTTALWGIGDKTAAKLAAMGIHTVNQLAAADPADLAERFGPTNGPWLRYLALGKGEATVSDTPWIPRGHSREATFTQDLTSPEEISAHVSAFARRLAAEADDAGRRIVRVTVKIRFRPFDTLTRQTKLPSPTTDPDAVDTTAVAILDRFDLTRPVRLIGVGVEYEPKN